VILLATTHGWHIITGVESLKDHTEIANAILVK